MTNKGSGSGEAAVEGQLAGTGGDEHEGHGEESKGELGAGIAAVEVYGDECYEHIDGDQEGPDAGEDAEEEREAAEEFGDGGDVAEPGGKAEAGDDLIEGLHGGEVVAGVDGSGGEDLGMRVVDHCEADGDAEEEEGPGLEAGKGAHGVPWAKCVKAWGKGKTSAAADSLRE